MAMVRRVSPIHPAAGSSQIWDDFSCQHSPVVAHDLVVAPPTPEELLANAEWLRRLAVSLVGPGAAEDVVQDTWVAALRRPPPRGRLREWLAVVATNLARTRFRREAVRAKHAPAVATIAEG